MRLGVTQQTLSALERHSDKISADRLLQVLHLYGVELVLRQASETSRHAEQDRRVFFQSQVLFWMLCATDSHAKNFSLFMHPGGSYSLTPLYDVLSAYPILGEAPDKLSPFRTKMAMAVRSKNPHWLMRDIQRRHWLVVGHRYGVISAHGQSAERVVDELIALTPEVIKSVRAKLPLDFSEVLAESILGGLQTSADKLAG
jgi:serine/threonine-protein kinase HipA